MAVALASALGAAPVAASAACPSQPERDAHQVRLLQTELMVAALSCTRDGASAYAPQYNAFIAKFRASLKQHAAVLKEEYRRAYGAKHEAALDRYVTQVANAASERSLQMPNYCVTVGPLFDQVLALKSGELAGFSQRFTFGEVPGFAQRFTYGEVPVAACAGAAPAAPKPNRTP
jgi:hypothetical protein